tara:strand:+ start:238 stop:2040 length:1803 start_codon:yes stop_codon:yes gene_type:complete
MVIYGNNLHEKLFGIAISKAYIKYATPYCDLVDDPELAPDIDLAVGFNQAINGDADAATTFTNTLILSGYLFDMSTKEFYRDKMTSNLKIWGGQIKRIKHGFQTNAFSDALKDCLNSPCNLFAETSDSIASMAQVASTKNGSNAFGVGSLSATFANIANGIDEAVTKKLPAIFGDVATELTQSIKSARSNIVAIAAGKKNLNELIGLANASGTMRSTNKIYRYTPDLKSYTDYVNLGNTILLKTKQELGGCFERFESSYRYNPFRDNTSVPASDQAEQYNGASYETPANGAIGGNSIGASSLQVSENLKNNAEGAITSTGKTVDGLYFSATTTIDGSDSGAGNYSVFGADIMDEGKSDIYGNIVIIDDYNAAPDDLATLQGKSFSPKIPICPSYPLGGKDSANTQAIIKAFEANKNQTGGKDGGGFLNKISIRAVSFVGPEINLSPKLLNAGAAMSEKLFEKLTGKNFKSFGAKALAEKNQLFVAVRLAVSNASRKFATEGGQVTVPGLWQLLPFIDINTQKKLNVDLTPRAYQRIFNVLPIGNEAKIYKDNQEIFDKYKVKVYIGAHQNLGAIEVQIISGDADAYDDYSLKQAEAKYDL